MSRQFGLSRPADVGGTTTGRALSRAGAARDLYEADCNLRENVTAAFVGCFISAPFAAVWFFATLVDWQGVGEWLYRLADFG